MEPAVPVGIIILAENPPREPEAINDGVVAIGFPPNVNERWCDGIKLEPDIVTIVPAGPLVRESETDGEVVCVNVVVAELVPSEAATGLEPAVPAGTIIVAENLPLEPDTTGEMGEIWFPPNVNVME